MCKKNTQSHSILAPGYSGAPRHASTTAIKMVGTLKKLRAPIRTPRVLLGLIRL